MWIFNKKIDFNLILLPMIGIPLFFILFPNINNFTLVFFLIAVQLFDVGHVYTTIWMTIFDKEEFQSNKKLYLYTPIIISIIFFSWIYLKIPYFWSFIAYFTIYHNIKQGYGIQRWYQKVNKRFCKNSNIFFYILTVFPVFIAHFREDLIISFYTEKKDMLFRYSGPDFHIFNIQFDNLLLFILLVFYFFTLIYFFINEFLIYKKIQKFELSRFLYMVSFIFMYGISFIYFDHIIKIASAIIISHALIYIYILYNKLPKLYPNKFNKKNKLILYLTLTILISSSINYYIQENLIDVSYHYLHNIDILQILFIIIYVIPTICHFIWDSHIWKSNHRFSKKIYK